MPRTPRNAADPTAPHFLTAPSVEILPTTGRQYRVRDVGPNSLPGFAVQVSAGGTKTFTLDYRVKGDRRMCRMTFGRFPLVSPVVARREAEKAKRIAASHRDPAKERLEENRQARALRSASRLEAEARRLAARVEAAAQKAASLHTFERLALDYIDERRTQLAEGTVALYEIIATRYLASDFGRQVITAVTEADARQFLRDVQEQKRPAGCVPATAPDETSSKGRTTKRRKSAVRFGGVGAARTLRRFLVTVWHYAASERRVASGTCPIPAAKKLNLTDKETERFLTAEECSRLLSALDTAAAVGLPPAPSRARVRVTGETAKHRPKIGVETPLPADPTAVAALRFTLFTGWRRGEVVSLRWDALRSDIGVIILRETKTGESVRAISPQAWAVLDALPRIVGSPWCFPSPRDKRKHLSDLVRLWTAVRHAAHLEGARFHDLRHTAASLALNAGASLTEVQSMLGHHSARATSRYAKLLPATGLRAAERLAAALDAARATPTPAEAVVTPITRRRRGRSA